jgi:asparagine synthase (glutamine-hydrolysing)
MPGLSLIYSNQKERSAKMDYEHILNCLRSAIYDESYRESILLSKESYLLSYTGYTDYPIEIFEDNDYWTCIEGRIYISNESVRRAYLTNIYESLFNSHLPEHKNKIVNWLLKTDGDFIVSVLKKSTNDLIILNDVLGRLPLYYYENQMSTIISREIQFISKLIGNQNNKFDKMAIAEYLLLGYVLGKRTLLNNVCRLDPGTIIKIDKNNMKVDKIYYFNFENKKYLGDDVNKSAKRLVSLFSEACKNRANENHKNVISLSGGFDSRSVIACFYKNKIPCIADL